jgi:DivIVA domain-containing protein
MDKDILNFQEKILNKKFAKKMTAGYDTTDVDTFFDEVIAFLNKVINSNSMEFVKVAEAEEKYKKLKEELEEKNAYIFTLENENKDLKKDGYANYRTNLQITELKNAVANLSKKIDDKK